jgi:hypothetical protein
MSNDRLLGYDRYLVGKLVSPNGVQKNICVIINIVKPVKGKKEIRTSANLLTNQNQYISLNSSLLIRMQFAVLS